MKVDYSKVRDRIKFWKEVVENVKDFIGTSPPALFVGRFGYPKIYVGILAPPTQQENAEVLDFPEKWYQQKASIEQILNYRGQLIYSRFRSNVKNPRGKLVEVTQELAMVKKPTDVEIQLKKNPKFRFAFSNWFAPIGNPAPVLKASLAENPSVERKVDYLISDFDIKAQDAVVELYKHKLPISRIRKIFSAGLLGLKIQRKFVPTRWSWAGVHDIIGESLRKKIINYQELSEIRVFHSEYIGNHFEILLLPGTYQYELLECWNLENIPSFGSDYESYWGRKRYVEVTGGAWYAARVSVLEYLDKIKRQAAVLIIREVSSEYFVPCGVWVIENAVKGAFENNYERFDSPEEAFISIQKRLRISVERYIQKSKLLKNYLDQRKILDFLKRI